VINIWRHNQLHIYSWLLGLRQTWITSRNPSKFNSSFKLPFRLFGTPLDPSGPSGPPRANWGPVGSLGTPRGPSAPLQGPSGPLALLGPPRTIQAIEDHSGHWGPYGPEGTPGPGPCGPLNTHATWTTSPQRKIVKMRVHKMNWQ